MSNETELPAPTRPRFARASAAWSALKSVVGKVTAPLRRLHQGPVGYALDLIALAVIWMLLSVWLNFRYPLPIPMADHWLISVEVGVLFGVFAVLRRFGIRVRWWAILALVAVGLLVRLFTTADNVSHRFLYRDFRVPLDLHLVPDFFSLLYDTSPARAVAGYAAAFSIALGGTLFLLFTALSFTARSMASTRFRRIFAGCFVVVAGLAIAQEFFHGPRLTTRAVSARISQEAVAFTRLPKERRHLKRTISDITRRIGTGERLDKLEGNNFILIFVESYGRTSLEKPGHRDLLMPRYEEMQQSLERNGFHVASNFLTSPTYGGFSWFAHGAFNTGFKVISHLHAQLLEELKPPTLADYFRDAGYHPINVAPGTTRPWPGMEDHFGMQHHYYSWEFGYRGPRYSFAPMADQFVLDYIQRREISRSKQPLFVEFALTCSHAPFDNIPRYMEDWSKLGNGSILHRQPHDRFKVGWAEGGDVAKAYATAVAYELRTIQGFLEEYVKDDSLVMFLGDHQPHQGITGSENLNWSVPVHVVSRNPQFVAPFMKRGYIRGMVPTQPLPHVGMERFLEEFLSDFSTEPLAVDPGIWPPAKERMEREEAKLR